MSNRLSQSERPVPLDENLNQHGADVADSICPLESPDTMNLLRSIRFNSFENALNAIEDFLGHLEITGQEPTFASASLLLESLIAWFEKADTDDDGALTKAETLRWCHNQSGKDDSSDWMNRHFDALCQANLLHSNEHTVSRGALENARDVFHQLAFLQTHFKEVTGPCDRGSAFLTAESLRQYLSKHHRSLAPADYAGLVQLVRYLKRLEATKAGVGEGSFDLSFFLNTSPEDLWAEDSKRNARG